MKSRAVCAYILKLEPGYLSLYSDGLLAGLPGIDFPQVQEIILCSTAFRPAAGPTQPPIKWVPGIKRPVREADHSPPSSAEVKNGRAISPLPHSSSWCGA
jgi:hypothetical protein